MSELVDPLPQPPADMIAGLEPDSTDEITPQCESVKDGKELNVIVNGQKEQEEQPIEQQEVKENGIECHQNPFQEDGGLMDDGEYLEDTRSEILKCLEWAESQQCGTRQQAVRTLPQCLFEAGQQCTERQQQMLWQVIEALAKDSDPTVRVEVLDNLSILSGICLDRQESMGPFGSGRVFPMPPNPLLVKLHRQCLIPALASLMQDRVLQVRKTSHMVLLRMADCRLISAASISRDIAPTVLELARTSREDHNDEILTGDTHDQRMEAATLIAKLMPYMDKDYATSDFLPTFLELCNDPSFHVRRACAAAMVELCQVLDAECIQNSLLTTFLCLCQDDAWSVRKACTESFMAISCVVEPQLRLEALAPRFLTLLRDNAKWVVAAAYQNLGPFISTFADPKRTGLELVRAEGTGQDAAVRRMKNYDAPVHPGGTPPIGLRSFENMILNCTTDNSPDSLHCPNTLQSPYPTPRDFRRRIERKRMSRDDETNNNDFDEEGSGASTDVNFNSFLYWRSPLPDVGLSMQKTPQKASTAAMQPHESFNESGSVISSDAACSPLTLNGSKGEEKDEECGVPIDLLDHFKLMLEPGLCHSVDCLDLPRNCAYSLPAVALALGPKHWQRHLRELVDRLSSDVQWKVRHSIASSLHSLVVIVGDRDAVNYILPLFTTFCRDLDEVRLPLLKNLHQICIHLEPDSRKLLLDSLFEFTKSENDRVWRLRDELAVQLSLIADCYDFSDRYRYFMPILSRLVQDKVAQVRTSAASCVGPLIWSDGSKTSKSALTEENNSGDGWNESHDDGSESDDSGRKVGAIKDQTITQLGKHSYYDCLELVLKKLVLDMGVKWQHKQSFIRCLSSIVSGIPENVDITLGPEVPAVTGNKMLKSLRNLTVVMKLLMPHIEALVVHRVPNVRLECASLLAKVIQRATERYACLDEGAVRLYHQERLSSVEGQRKPVGQRKRTVFRRVFKSGDVDPKVEDATGQDESTRCKMNTVIGDAPHAQEEDATQGGQSEARNDMGVPKVSESDADLDDGGSPQFNDEGGDDDRSVKPIMVLGAVGLESLTNALETLWEDKDEDVWKLVVDAVNTSAETQKLMLYYGLLGNMKTESKEEPQRSRIPTVVRTSRFEERNNKNKLFTKDDPDH